MPSVYHPTTQRETALEPADDEPSDDEIVRRAQAGDREAFAELIRRFERPALAIAFAALADGEAAGDAVQGAFVRAWQKLADLRRPERFGAWLCGIVRNIARDEKRRCRRELRVRAEVSLVARRGGEPDPAAEYSRMENDQRLAAALARLDELSRAAVTLRYYEGLSSKDKLALMLRGIDRRLAPPDARALLERVITITASEAGLKPVVDMLRKETGANIVVNAKALKAAGADLNGPLRFELRDVTLATALKTIAMLMDGDRRAVGYTVEDDVIMISAK